MSQIADAGAVHVTEIDQEYFYFPLDVILVYHEFTSEY